MATRSGVDLPPMVPGWAAPATAWAAALPRWLVVLAAALAARAVTFGSPVIHVDEEFYFLTAMRMLEGAVPFVDVWDRKPVGLFLLYLPPAALGVPLGIWAYQLLALGFVVATGVLIIRLAERAGWGAGGLAAALLYVFALNFADGQGGQSPVFYNLMVAAAVLLVLPRAEDRSDDPARLARWLGAMLLIGVALQVKYSVVFEGFFLGLWLMWREHRIGTALPRILLRGAALAAVALAPTALAWAVFAAMGHGEAWLYANFTSILDRKSDPAATLAWAAFKLVLILGPLMVMSALSRPTPVGHPDQHKVRALLFGWLVAAVVGLIVFGSWFNHYALPVMLPGALCSAGFLGCTAWGRRLAPLLLLLIYGGGMYTMLDAARWRGNRVQLEALAEGIGRGPGCLYVYSGTSMVHAYTGRCAVSPWLFPSHLTRDREDGALGVDQLEEIDRIFARGPELVMMRPHFNGERQAVRDRMFAHLKAGGYRLRGEYPMGGLKIALYARDAAAAPARPASSPE